MDKYKRYYGVTLFLLVLIAACVFSGLYIKQLYDSYTALKLQEADVANVLETKKSEESKIRQKIIRLRKSIMTTQKKIYSPVEDKLGDDTLFFTLYSDLIDMVHSNSIKIDSIEYKYNPDNDNFVKQGSAYFVCDVNLKLVSNYVNLGKLVQDIYQYPYYMKINDIEVSPYAKDKKILLTTMSVRLYAHTSPEETYEEEQNSEAPVNGAQTPIPQE